MIKRVFFAVASIMLAVFAASAADAAPKAVSSVRQAAATVPVTVYVVNYGSDSVTPIPAATNKAGPPITVGSEPGPIAITPNGDTAYVVNQASASVTPINTATNKAGPPITVTVGLRANTS